MGRLLTALGLVAALAACGSKNSTTSGNDAVAARKGYAHSLGESMRKAGVTATFDTRGDDASTLVVSGPCDRGLLDQLIADSGDSMRGIGFATIECDHGGESIVLTKTNAPSGAAQRGSDPWAP